MPEHRRGVDAVLGLRDLRRHRQRSLALHGQNGLICFVKTGLHAGELSGGALFVAAPEVKRRLCAELESAHR